MYNRYVGNTGKVYIVADDCDNQTDKSAAHIKDNVPSPAFSGGHRSNEPKRERVPPKSGELSFLEGFLPRCFKSTDILIIVLLLFLFLESRDEDFLIILGFFAWSIFREK